MAKAKFNAKEFLLRRGEVLVMGVAGFFLVLMLLWGANKWGSAMDPGKESKTLTDNSNSVYNKIKEKGTLSPDDEKQLTPPEWIGKASQFKTVKVPEFTQSGQPLFDPTAQPSTKRENPLVLTIGEYQVDLTRAAMLGYDIILDAAGDPLIAVLTKKADGKLDEEKLQKASEMLRNAVLRKKDAQNKINANPPKNNPMGMMGMMGMGGDLGPGPGGPGGKGRGGNPYGQMGGEFEQSGQRVENAIKYIPLKEIDTAVKAGERPAFTVIPLRLVTVHAVVPYKKQLAEIKRALRLPNPPPTAKKEDIERAEADAKVWGPWYDGYEVQRKVTQVMPNGEVIVLEDWPETKDPKDTSGNYKFEETYIDKIDTKKIADHFDEGYIPYFLKPDLMLSMPLPQLAKDLNVKYPEIKLKDILDNIEKLKKANQKEIPASELAKQLAGLRNKSELYRGKTADNLDGFGIEGKKYGQMAGPGGMGPMPGMPGMPGSPPKAAGGGPSQMFPEGYGPNSTVAVAQDVDNFLLRFVDCDVKPGRTYEYRIRLRMINPNFGQDKLVSVPEYAKDSHKILYSKWLQLETLITVPAESFLYSHDVKGYRDRIDDTYLSSGKDSTTESKALNSLLQVKDNQAVVQITRWMEQVKAGEGSKREPVGSWVVAEMPVGRGEFIGRKQFIKLPLWSSETEQYVLREVSDKVVKGKYQPKGWLVDFSTQSVLVDFEGGKVRSRSNFRFDPASGNLVQGGRPIEEDVATEMLIVRPDGKLVVRSSLADDADLNRKSITSEWTKWVDEVGKRKAGGAGTGEPNPFEPKKP